MSAPKIAKCCDDCGGTNVSIEATARWSIEKQAWEITAAHTENAYCDDCGADCSTTDGEVS